MEDIYTNINYNMSQGNGYENYKARGRHIDAVFHTSPVVKFPVNIYAYIHRFVLLLDSVSFILQ